MNTDNILEIEKQLEHWKNILNEHLKYCDRPHRCLACYELDDIIHELKYSLSRLLK